MADTSDISDNKLNEMWTKEHRDIIYMVCKKTDLNEQQAYSGLIKYEGDYKKVIAVANMHKSVKLVTRHTTYNDKEAFELLQKNNWDILKIIRQYMGTKPQEKGEMGTINQTIFKEIRSFMNTVIEGYNERKEQGERFKTLQNLYADKTKN
jgi:hypothetical protein